jgi:hypothetical protein
MTPGLVPFVYLALILGEPCPPGSGSGATPGLQNRVN